MMALAAANSPRNQATIPSLANASAARTGYDRGICIAKGQGVLLAVDASPAAIGVTAEVRRERERERD